MGSDGTLTPSHSQRHFTRHYSDGFGQKQAADKGEIFSPSRKKMQRSRAAFDPTLQAGPVAHAKVLAAIKSTALRYAGHPGLRNANLSVADWSRLYRANIEVESAYRQEAVSHAGAIGLGQLMPATARALRVNPHDLMQNLDGSARYLAAMLKTFGDPRLALAAYNAGPDAVRRYAGIPPFRETQNHVTRVLAVAARLKGSNS